MRSNAKRSTDPARMPNRWSDEHDYSVLNVAISPALGAEDSAAFWPEAFSAVLALGAF